ncbi:LysM peptidoglycan-binding domain-containing protein [Cellulomonas xiejunii]|uniref:LysM peptidoglycan-binding domain-containing protein n=1 Tax=Cellulomonas xiejunii TaxID=2968083 RepID=A0ABY5KJ26_9CELL|nr:LysM domain-containing protein [Cellulomonas xiejunii]MCC2320163.1 LysM peptidoglycan-binding domain-containing protein [Cellulomonas xiejunii]UUI70472.1 LysM peptidoglycan-binding domain-containing protein [Cellulomonas xiejunii]
MIDRSTHPPARSPRPAATAGGLVLAGTTALVVAAVLGLWVVDHLTATALWRVETVVAPAVVAVGAVAGAWVGVSALVAGTCAAVRAAGGAWRAGEVAVQRWAPGLVRRALAVAVAAGVGITGAAGAHATVEGAPAAGSVTVDLGWSPTTGDVGTATWLQDAASTSAPDPTPAPTALPELPGVAPQAPADVVSDTPPAVTPTTTPDAGGAQSAPDAGAAQGANDTTSEPSGVRTAPVALPVATPLPPAAHAAPPAPAAPTAGTVEVRPGDTLWGLAAKSLGPDASDAAIAAEWPRWYVANASTIGPDPDVLRPGQVLVVPVATDGGTR